MERAIQELLNYLPPDIQAIVRNPPSLLVPSSFLPAFRLVSTWGRYIIVAVAVWIVWSFVSGFFGYFYRFFRFWAKLAPVIGLIGWVMAQSGQGSLPDLIESVKQWTGISAGNGAGAGAGGQAPGIAQLAGMFGLGSDSANTNKRSNKRTTRSASSKTRKGKAAAEEGGLGLGDFAEILKSAAGSGTGGGLGAGPAGAGGGEWQDVVQGYVKNAMLKASGLDWLFGQGDAPEQKKRTR